MPIDYPSYQQIVERTRAQVVASLPNVDPSIFGSFIRAITDSQAGRSFDVVNIIQQLELALMPDTAPSDYLERWAAYEGLSRLSETPASGDITITGISSIGRLIN